MQKANDLELIEMFNVDLRNNILQMVRYNNAALQVLLIILCSVGDIIGPIGLLIKTSLLHLLQMTRGKMWR